MYLKSKSGSTDTLKHIKNDLENVTKLNAMLTIICITIREEVKGWAVGAKKLEENSDYRILNNEHGTENNEKHDSESDRNIFEEGLAQFSKEIVTQGDQLTISLYPTFLAILQNEMEDLIKKEEYLYERVALERIIQNSIKEIPYRIDSSYAKISYIANKYDHFSELLYLLYESFPTLSVAELYTGIVGNRLLNFAQ